MLNVLVASLLWNMVLLGATTATTFTSGPMMVACTQLFLAAQTLSDRQSDTRNVYVEDEYTCRLLETHYPYRHVMHGDSKTYTRSPWRPPNSNVNDIHENGYGQCSVHSVPPTEQLNTESTSTDTTTPTPPD